jgi:hypothetical protein
MGYFTFASRIPTVRNSAITGSSTWIRATANRELGPYGIYMFKDLDKASAAVISEYDWIDTLKKVLEAYAINGESSYQ